VLLYSRINNLTQTFTFRNSSSDSDAMTSSSDPTLLALGPDVAGHNIQMALEPCSLEGDMSLDTSGPGQAYLARGLNFYKLFMLRSDLSMHETIVYNQILSENGDPVENISWAKVSRRRKEGRAKAGVGEFDDFLDPSELHRSKLPSSKLPLQLPSRIERTSFNAAHRTADHKILYDTLMQIESAGEATIATIDISRITSQLSQLLAESSDVSQLPIGTL
jgi:RNA polymerase I-specific transcription initiation factor RRN6